MHRATKDWMLGYVREYIGVNRIAHIPIARFNDAISFLESQKKPIDAYLRERIRNAVSYTHLDVYKRQPWWQGARIPYFIYRAFPVQPLRRRRG